MQKATTCLVKDLGLIGYAQAYEFQKKCVQDLLQGGPQVLILCEHPPVLTLGRMAKRSNILVSHEELAKYSVGIHAIDRGGDITLHAPGQAVMYPIFNLSHMGKDLRRYLHHLEQVAIDLLKDFDILTCRFPGRTGVWVGSKKIVSIGVGVKHWVTFHGLAININTDLPLFNLIKPCGLEVQMTSVQQLQGTAVDMRIVKQLFQRHCLRIFTGNFSPAF